ncbi:MAG TPA: NRDE family protein [Candidatus Limnocylindria bacterium]|nr:NRDE family protein [Candidatus Limnocylindria bacterium]
MCTLILGRDVLDPETVLVAANRDEDPNRPSDPPGVLHESPRVVGGRDRVAGGTWLAVRERRAIVAMLNRRDRSGGPSPPAPDRRSRGLLALDVATAPDDYSKHLDPSGQHRELLDRLLQMSGPGFPFAALYRLFAALWEARYAPFTMVFAAPRSCWIAASDGEGTPRCAAITSGWHVLTHADLDDAAEPRTAHLLRQLDGYRPRSVEKAEQFIGDLLRAHGAASAPGAPARPAVCLHEGPVVTVSSAIICLSARNARYRHAEGRPCQHPLADVSHLLADASFASEKP